jgi:hypothetical protein
MSSHVVDGLPWISLQGDVAGVAGEILQRKDVREMLVQLCPIRAIAMQLSPDEWHTIMSVGAGLSNLKATRLTDDKTVVSGVLSDNPPLLCEFSMAHSPQREAQREAQPEVQPRAVVFCISTLKMMF